MPRRIYPNLNAYFRDSDRTQAEVADALGISDGYLSMIKSGQRQPPLGLALKIASHCQVPLESLVLRHAS